MGATYCAYNSLLLFDLAMDKALGRQKWDKEDITHLTEALKKFCKNEGKGFGFSESYLKRRKKLKDAEITFPDRNCYITDVEYIETFARYCKFETYLHFVETHAGTTKFPDTKWWESQKENDPTKGYNNRYIFQVTIPPKYLTPTIRVIENVGNSSTPNILHFNVQIGEGGSSFERTLDLNELNAILSPDELHWYFNEYLEEPWVQTRPDTIVESIPLYGDYLFQSVLAPNTDEAWTLFWELVNTHNFHRLTISIESRSPSFEALLWETMKRPEHDNFLFKSNVRFCRKPQAILSHRKVTIRPGKVLRILLVTARPGGRDDVAYETLQRPIVQLARGAKYPVEITLLRPGTFEALRKHLEKGKFKEYYHIIHLDMHGTMLSKEQYNDPEKRQVNSLRFAIKKTAETFNIDIGVENADAEMTSGEKWPFLLFESTSSQHEATPIAAYQLANVIEPAGIPVCIINACHSASTSQDSVISSFATDLSKRGIQQTLAMQHSISTDAAKIMLSELYANLVEQKTMANSFNIARNQLFSDKNRRGAADMKIELNDWISPVLYTHVDGSFALQKLEREDLAQWGASMVPIPRFKYPFVGRDMDIHVLEQLLGRHGQVHLRGMYGSGKSCLVTFLKYWWQSTRFCNIVIDLDEETHWTFPIFLNKILLKLDPSTDLKGLNTTDIKNTLKAALPHFRQKTLIIFDSSSEHGIQSLFETENDFKQVFNFIQENLSQGSDHNLYSIFSSPIAEPELQQTDAPLPEFQLLGMEEKACYELIRSIFPNADQHEGQKAYENLVSSFRHEVEQLIALCHGLPAVLIPTFEQIVHGKDIRLVYNKMLES
jgi:hypothetical protein